MIKNIQIGDKIFDAENKKGVNNFKFKSPDKCCICEKENEGKFYKICLSDNIKFKNFICDKCLNEKFIKG